MPQISVTQPNQGGRGGLGKKAVRWTVKLAITIGLFALIFRPDWFGITKPFIEVRWGEVWAQIKQVRLGTFLPWILLGSGLKLCGIFCAILRWRLLLGGQGIRLKFSHLAGSFFVGRFAGIFLPGTLGLDGYRFYDVGRHSGKWIESATVIAVEKLIGFIALTFLVFVTLPLGLTFLKFNPLMLAAILAVLFGFLAVSFTSLLNPRVFQALIAAIPVRHGSKIEDKLNQLAQSVTAYSGQRPLLLTAVFLGFMVHFLTALLYFCTAMAIRTQGIHIAQILFASPIVIYGTVIGPSIGGEGIREAVFVMLLGAHVGSAQAFLFAHLGLWAGEAWSLAGGLILLLRPAGFRPQIDLTLLEQRSRTAPAPMPPEETAAWRRTVWATAAAAVVGGVLGSALVGLIEAAYAVGATEKLPDKWILAYAWIAHGVLGFAAGVGLAGLIVFAMILRRRPWAARRVAGFSAGAVFFVIGFVIFQFLLKRDFLREQPPALSDRLHLLLIAGLCFFALRWGLSGLARLRPFRGIPRLGGGLAVYGCVLLACVMIGAFARRPETGPPAPKPIPAEMAKRPGLLLICVDTLRADRLECYGYAQVKTPAISALAADGILYEKAIAQASWTRPSIVTILTGLYPSTHGAAAKSDKLDVKTPTLAGTLRQQGIFTCGLVNNANIAPFMGFGEGFDHYVYLTPDALFGASESASALLIYRLMRQVWQRFAGPDRLDVLEFYHPAAEVSEQAMEWIGRIKSVPFFYFVHYMDPHDPYMVHPFDQHKGFARVALSEAPPFMREPMHKAYLGEIEYTDQQIGRLIEHLKREGLYDAMTIILTADHGEEFREHGSWWHGRTLYEEMIHVPLIVKLPGGRHAGTRAPDLVRLLDVAPTACDLLGAPVPAFMQGVSLTRGGEPVDPGLARVFSEEDFEGNVLQSAREARWKLNLANEGNPRKLPAEAFYDLTIDSSENLNLLMGHGPRVSDMKAWIRETQEKAKAAGMQLH